METSLPLARLGRRLSQPHGRDATIEDARVIRQVHAHLGLPIEGPGPYRSRPPPGLTAGLSADLPAHARGLAIVRGPAPSSSGRIRARDTSTSRIGPTWRAQWLSPPPGFRLDKVFIRALVMLTMQGTGFVKIIAGSADPLGFESYS